MDSVDSDVTVLGLCACGCGKPTKVATRTQTSQGHVRGKPLRFLQGHSSHRANAWGTRELSPTWQGDAAGYRAAHQRILNQRGRADTHPCAHCGGLAHHWAYDHQHALVGRVVESGPGIGVRTYSLEPDDYVPLCWPCHRQFDQPGKLTPQDVLEIRARAAAGVSNAQLGAVFGVNDGHISKIVTGARWSNLAGAIPPRTVARKTMCSQGHPFTAETTYIYVDRLGKRQCLICKREARRRWLAKPEVAAAQAARQREYRARPEVAAAKAAYSRERRRRAKLKVA